ncbi:MAG: HTH domain-containing protein, partial [Termitinemataceae bacterium]
MPNTTRERNIQKTSTKATVLSLLRRVNDFVSGEWLAKQAGVSRVAVWKAVEALRQAGYPIESRENGGYRLDEGGGTDFLYPWEFPNLEDHIFYF